MGAWAREDKFVDQATAYRITEPTVVAVLALKRRSSRKGNHPLAPVTRT